MSYDQFAEPEPPKPPGEPAPPPAVPGQPDGTLVPVNALPGEQPTGTATPIPGTGGAIVPGAVVPPKPPGPPIDYAMPAPRKPFTIPKYAGCLVKMIFGFTVLIFMGYFALVALNPKARKWATQGAKDGSGGPTPFKAMNQILALPAQAMGKTQDVVDANNARVGVLDGVVKEEEGKGKAGAAGASRQPVIDPFAKPAPTKAGEKGGATEPADNTISRQSLLALAEKAQADSIVNPANDAKSPQRKAEPPPPPGPPELKLSGGIVITNSAEVGGPPATAAFMYWIAGLNITGISQTSPPRFLLNNRLIYAGDEINKSQGIVFTRLDPVNKLLYFRDKTGAVISRSYL